MLVEAGVGLVVTLVLLHVLFVHFFRASPDSKIQAELQEEECQANVLLRQKAFNEKCCLRCCATFNFLFKKRLLCALCHFYVCRDCATWNPVERIWLCKFCEKKRIWKIQSCLNKTVTTTFPEGIRCRTRSSSSSSSKANPVLTKAIGDSESEDLDNDSGYDPSLSVCSRGSSVRALPPMRGLFNGGPSPPNCHPTDHEGNLLLPQCSDLSLLKEEEVPIDPHVLQIREHIESLVEKLINGNLDNTKLHHLYNHPEYQPLSDQETPTCAHTVLKEIVCEILEEAMGLPPLNGAETGSLATSSPNFSNDDDLNDVLQTQSYEEILATAILNKIIEHHQRKNGFQEKLASPEDVILAEFLDNGISLQMDRQKYTNKEIQTEDETDGEEGLRSTSFHSNLTYSSRNSDVGSESAGEDFSWNDGAKGPMEYTIEEQIEEITTTVEESESDSEKSRRKRPTPLPRQTMQEPTVTKTLVSNNMTLADLDFLYSGLDFGHASKVPFPELGLDIVEATNGILENEEFLKDISVLISTSEDWKDNWLFRKKAILQAYRNMRGRIVTCTDPVPMLIPNPVVHSRTRIGSRDIDELSEMSEKNSINSVEYFSSSDESDDNDVECSSLTHQKLQYLSGEIVSEYSPKDHEYIEAYINNTHFPFQLNGISSQHYGCGDVNNELNNLNRPDPKPVPLPRKTKSSILPITEAQSTSTTLTTTVTTVTSALSITLQSPSQSMVSSDSNSTSIASINNSYCSVMEVDEAVPSIKFLPPAARPLPLEGLKFAHPPSNTTVHQGRIVRFSCVIDAKIPYEVSWFFGMEQLQNNEHYQIFQIDDKAFLHIYETDVSDQGTYSCVLNNQDGQVWTDFRLTVRATVQPLSSPSFMETLRDEIVCEGKSVCLTCKVTGHPEPQIHWFKNGVLLQLEENKYKSENFHRGQWTLYISEVTIKDQGEYSAKAINRIGESCSIAYIKIVPPGTKTLKTLTKRVNNAQDEVHVEAEKLLKSANQENASTALRQITGQALDIVAATNCNVRNLNQSLINSSLNEDSHLKHKPGTIAEREHQKWLNPTGKIPNNPYSPENLVKRATAAKNLDFTSKRKLPPDSITNDLVVDEIPQKIDCGLRTIDSTRYKRDYYINDKEQKKNAKEQSFLLSNHVMLPETHKEGSALNNIEEKVYLAAGKMSTLENKIRLLEVQVEKVKEDTPSRKVADLEDRVAHAAAQITQNEKQVSVVETEVARMQEIMEKQEHSLKTHNKKATVSSPHISMPNGITLEQQLMTASRKKPSLSRSQSLLNRAVSMENLNNSFSMQPAQDICRIGLSKNLSASVSHLNQNNNPQTDVASSSGAKATLVDMPTLPSVKELASRFQNLQNTNTNSVPSLERKKSIGSNAVNIFPQTTSAKKPLEMDFKNGLSVGKKMNKLGKHHIEVTDENQSDSGCGLEISTNQISSEGINSSSVREISRKFSLDDASSSSEGRMEQEPHSGSSVRRVHSLTARSLSKEFREQAKRNLPRQLNRHMSIAMDDSESSSPSGLPSPENFHSFEKYPRRSSASSSKKNHSDNKRQSSVTKNHQWIQSPDTDAHGYTSDESNTSTGSLLYRQNISNSILRRAAYWDRRVEEGLTSDASLSEDFSQTFAS